MNFETWIAFCVTYLIISVIPGPSVITVTAQALSRGFMAAMLCVLGDVLGGLVVMSVSFLGLGVILSKSATLYMLIKWLGVFYLAYLGLRQIYDARQLNSVSLYRTPKVASLRVGFITGVLNPKAIVFYVAFLSQFINPEADSITQFSILVMSSSFIVAVVLTGYALSASWMRNISTSIKAQKRFGYFGGSCMLGSSIFFAQSR